jgi:predicted transcriptional regulator
MELRKAAGLSQYELADLLNVPQSNVSFWEQCEKPPRGRFPVPHLRSQKTHYIIRHDTAFSTVAGFAGF